MNAYFIKITFTYLGVLMMTIGKMTCFNMEYSVINGKDSYNRDNAHCLDQVVRVWHLIIVSTSMEDTRKSLGITIKTYSSMILKGGDGSKLN